MGELIVFEGLDGSGKATQAKLFCDYLNSKNIKSMQVTFPNYQSDSSALVKMYLNGEFGTNPNDVNAYAASSFYSVDRYAAYKSQWGQYYSDDYIIVADRYTTSNAVHQCSKLNQNEWDSYLNWLFKFEYDYIGIPKPNKVFFLDVEPLISQDLMTKRYSGTHKKKDIHENDLEYLKKSYNAAHYCMDKFAWQHIKCSENGNMRSINDIHDNIVNKYNNI